MQACVNGQHCANGEGLGEGVWVGKTYPSDL